ncbi:conserved hypothetical protein [Azospirillaceae bacterium]
MPVMENADKKKKTWIILAVIIILIIVFVVFFMGIKGIVKITGTIMTLLIVAGIIGLIGYFVYHTFFMKHRFDITYVNKQKLIQAGKINSKGHLMGDLYLSGDAGHSRVRIGKIGGYCRIQILTRQNVYDDNGKIKSVLNKKTNEYEPVYETGKAEQDVFVINKGGIIGLFSEPMVIRVSPQDHDDLIGDVTIKGFSLLPHSEYLFLNSDYLDVRIIDYAVLKEAERGIMFETLRDMKSIVDKATGVDALHKKSLEQKNLVDVPEKT